MAFTLERPDLKPLARDLIDLVERAAGGGGGVPMLQLVELFGIELDEDKRLRLTERGEIAIDSEGAAANEGREEHFSGALVNLHIPASLRGVLTLERGGFVLAFDSEEHGIVAKKGFLKAMVRSLQVFPDRADLEMSNSMFTLHFTW